MRKPPFPLVLITLLWAGGLAFGFHRLMSYSATPGEASQARDQWPAQSRLSRVEGQGSLVLFAHPRCSCSRATFAELARLLPATRDKLHVTVVFNRPEGFSEEWAKGDLWRMANALPGVTTLIDDGFEMHLFGAKTSGQVFLYDKDGRLSFEGGITRSRGHEGHSPGHDAIYAYADRRPASLQQSAVFGCSLEKRELKLEAP